MLRLVAKDFRITRLFWLPAVFSYLVFLLMFFEIAPLMLAVGIVLVLVLSVCVLYIDDLHRTDVLYGALPATRRDVVLARFLSVGILTLVCLGLFYSGTAGIMALIGGKAAHLKSLMTPKAGLAFAGGVGIAVSLFFPLYFRLGLGRAVLRFLISVLGGSVAAGILLRLTETQILAFLNRGKEASEKLSLSGPALIPPLLVKIESSLGGGAFSLLVLAVTAAAVFASARLSMRLYSRRDL